jgi:hypothetical protein
MYNGKRLTTRKERAMDKMFKAACIDAMDLLAGLEFDSRLVCFVERLSYDFISRTGDIHFPPDNCCDAKGVIKLFKGIDPKVSRINTFAGGIRDTYYCLQSGVWQPYLGDAP